MGPLVGAAPAGPSAWSSTDVLRISVEGKGMVGFVEVGSSSTLADARQKIVAEVDGLSDSNGFQFQLPDGVPISRKQEICILAREFLPVVHLRTRDTTRQHRQGQHTPLSHGAGAAQADAHQHRHLGPFRASAQQQREQGGSYVSNKVTVSFLGEPYHLWVTTGYTFAQLRREAARYWSFPSEQVVLMDEDGCAWPDSAIVSAVLATGMLDRREILLVRKPHVAVGNETPTLRSEAPVNFHNTSSNSIRTSRCGPSSPHVSASGASIRAGALSPGSDAARREISTLPRPQQHLNNSDTEVIAVLSQLSSSEDEKVSVRDEGKSASHADVDTGSKHNGGLLGELSEIDTDEKNDAEGARSFVSPEDGHAEAFATPRTYATTHGDANGGNVTAANVVMERYTDLWRAFTYYCAQIDSNRPFSMDRRGFYGFLQDCNLVDDRSFSPAKLNLIFTATCKNGKRSNRMCFADFLDALMMLTRKIRAKQTGRKTLASPQQRPLTSTEKAQEEYAVLTSFVQLLTHVVLPRAASWNLHKWDLHTAIADRPEVLSTLQPFVKPFYEIFSFYAPAVPSNKLDMETDACFYWPTFSIFALDFQFAELNIRPWLAEIFVCAASQIAIPLKGRASSSQGARIGTRIDDTDEPERSQPLMTQQRYLLQHATGEPVWERPVMQFGQFLNALLRVAWYAFPELATGRKPEMAVKALIQHFSKCLRKSYVMDILDKRKEVSKYPLGLMQGTTLLYRRYVDMWKADGQPDYLDDEEDDDEAEDFYHGPERTIDGQNSGNVGAGFSGAASPRAGDLPSTPMNRPRSHSGGTKRSASSASSRKAKDSSFLGDGRRVLEQLVAAEEARTAGGNPNGPAVAALLGLRERTPTNQHESLQRQRARSSFGFLDGDDDDDDCVEHRLESLLGGDASPRDPQSPIALRGSVELGNAALGQGSHPPSPARGPERESRSLDPTSTADVDTLGSGSPRCSVTTQSPKDYSMKPINNADLASTGAGSKGKGGCAAAERNGDFGGMLDAEEKDHDSDNDSADDDGDLPSSSRSKMSGHDKISAAATATSTASSSEIRGNYAPHLSDNEDGSLTLASVDLLGRVSQPTYELLCHGGVFLKHGRRGYPHRRFVWCDERLQRVYWCPVDRKPSKTGPRVRARSLAVREITQVTDGLQTDRLQRLLKHGAVPWNLRRRSGSVSSDSDIEVKRSLCFSLHGKNRTLDLEADDGDLRGEWIEAFAEVLRLQRQI